MLRYVTLVLWCSIAAVLTAAFAGEDLTLSLRVWLASFVGWFATWFLSRVLLRTRLVPSRFRLLAAYSMEEDVAPRALHDFRSLENLLLRSRDNERTHRQQLRPRLLAVADHFLLVNHGINRSQQPDQTLALLGDVAWLVDADLTSADSDSADLNSRAPTLEEIDRFMDRLLIPQQA